jgi:hypothetical protein
MTLRTGGKRGLRRCDQWKRIKRANTKIRDVNKSKGPKRLRILTKRPHSAIQKIERSRSSRRKSNRELIGR